MRRIVIAALVPISLLAACQPKPVEMNPTLLAQIVETVRPTATATRTPTPLPTATPDAGVTTPIPQSIEIHGDPAAGQVLFGDTTRGYQACKTCHRIDSETRLVGPGLYGVRARAGTRVDGLTPEDYIRQSITDPAAFIVPGYANLMPKLFARALSDQELADIVAYVLSLGE